MKSLWADLRLTNRKSIWEWGGGWVTVRHEMSWSYLANGGCRTPAVWLSSSHSPSAWCHLGERGQRHHTVRFVIITTQTEDIDQMRSDTHILGHCSYFFCGVKVLIIISFIPNLFNPTLHFGVSVHWQPGADRDTIFVTLRQPQLTNMLTSKKRPSGHKTQIRLEQLDDIQYNSEGWWEPLE